MFKRVLTYVGELVAEWWPGALRARIADADREIARLEAENVRLRSECDAAVRDYWRVVEKADAAGFDCVRLEAQRGE